LRVNNGAPNDEHDRLRIENGLLHQRLAALQAEHDKAQTRLTHSLAELGAVYRSRSWRVTRPVRALTHALRRLPVYGRKVAHVGRLERALRRSAVKSLVWTAARITRMRLRWGRPRSLWGITPILTLPLLAECDRRLGLRSCSLVYHTYYIRRDFDINLERPLGFIRKHMPSWETRFVYLLFAWTMLRYDVFHFFLDRGILPSAGRMGINPLEAELLHRAGKRLYTYTYGADVRTREGTLRLGTYNFCVDCPEPARFCICDDAAEVEMIAAIEPYATAMLAMGDMLAYVPAATELHFWPIDTSRFVPSPPDFRGDRPLRVFHAPNHAHFKGTRHLEAAIERLRAQGRAIELERVQGLPNNEVLARMSACDLVAEQFIGGFHGYTALEAMALGKPVICFVRERRLLAGAEDCPLLDADPDRLEGVLRDCATGRHDLAALGRQGRAYVEKYHSIDAVAGRLGRLYLADAGLPRGRARLLEQVVCQLEARLRTIVVPQAAAVPALVT
jgi:glycosyltransferase involved in cell wall biosynthesis